MHHPIARFLHRRKYEILLAALVQHLFIGIFFIRITSYSELLWAVNFILLGTSSIGIFIEKGRLKNLTLHTLFIVVLCLSIIMPFVHHVGIFYPLLGLTYVLFFSYIFLEVLHFLLKPSYINIDIIVAAACGYFLLLEVSVFAMMSIYCLDAHSFKGVSTTSMPATYFDFIYFCSLNFTCIGSGDIQPNMHVTKLLTAFLGIAGQFYTVMLVGLLISKFSSGSTAR
ncbi:MAG TPA: ion channel [Puia sp.]|uniref:ion channel n=1 Tax=Puia sp. TaxID=2045100 RepID=UPI002C1973A4|nr:ion channel [Puia sp.]HVU96383.1 ion channel [Puia sp.]